MNETQKTVIWMLVAGAAFLGGVLVGDGTGFWTLARSPQVIESGTASSIPVVLRDMTEGRALIHMKAEDPDYECVKEQVYTTAGVWDPEFLRFRPSLAWAVLRDKTRLYCGRAITVVIDVPRTYKEANPE